QSQAAIIVIQERKQFRGCVEPHQRVMRVAARIEILDLAGQLVEDILLVDSAAIAILGVQDIAILTLAPENALHELEDDVAFPDIILRLNRLERKQAATPHSES